MTSLTDRFDPIDAAALHKKADDLSARVALKIVEDAKRRARLYGIDRASDDDQKSTGQQK